MQPFLVGGRDAQEEVMPYGFKTCRLGVALLLLATVLIRFDTMEIVIYVDQGTEIDAPTEFVVQEACNVVRSMGLALPAPYRIHWRKKLPTGGAIPDDSKAVKGMLNSCERA
jgi:hypothetical protein